MIGKLKRVGLKEVWKNEPQFTKWLVDNIDVLGDIIDLALTNPESEGAAGAFKVDITAEDDAGNPVVIENQFGKSDHGHLGQLVTYLTALDAKTAIWIVEHPRPEHIQAITWLNESSPTEFYFLKMEAVQIGNSPPAPLLTLIVGPSEEGKEVGTKKKEYVERDSLRQQFWAALLKKSKEKTNLFSNISPSKYSWISAGAGKRGIGYVYTIAKDRGSVELVVDLGKGMNIETHEIFYQLKKSKDKINKAFGEQLEYDIVEERRNCHIRKQIKLGGYRNENKWDEIQEAMIDTMICLVKATKPFIEKI